MIYANARLAIRKSLVTGANGFLGSNVVRALLARGDDVTCLVRPTSQVAHLRALPVRIIHGDVTDYDSLRSATRGVDQVYHVAGLPTAVHVEEYYRVNSKGMENIARACAANTTPPTLVIISSLAAAGPGQIGRPRRESDPAHPVSHYGRSKRAGELAAERYAGVVPITVIRPPIIFGPQDRASLPLFRAVAQFGVLMIPGVQRIRYSLIHAEDLAQLMLLAAERGERLAPMPLKSHAFGQGYYFAAGEVDPTYDEFVRSIGRAVGRRRVLAIPTASFVIWTVGGITEFAARLTGRAQYLNLDKVAEMLAGSWICSPEKAVRGLGFAVAAPLETRMQETAEWYRAHGWLNSLRRENGKVKREGVRFAFSGRGHA